MRLFFVSNLYFFCAQTLINCLFFVQNAFKNSKFLTIYLFFISNFLLINNKKARKNGLL